MAFGKEIKRLREKANLSAQKLADAIGIDADRLRKWEQKDMDPRDEDTKKIEAYFGMGITEVMLLDALKFQEVPMATPDALESELPLGGLRVTVKDYVDLLTMHSEIMTRLVNEKLLNSTHPLGSTVNTAESQELKEKYAPAAFAGEKPQVRKKGKRKGGNSADGHTVGRAK